MKRFSLLVAISMLSFVTLGAAQFRPKYTPPKPVYHAPTTKPVPPVRGPRPTHTDSPRPVDRRPATPIDNRGNRNVRPQRPDRTNDYAKRNQQREQQREAKRRIRADAMQIRLETKSARIVTRFAATNIVAHARRSAMGDSMIGTSESTSASDIRLFGMDLASGMALPLWVRFSLGESTGVGDMILCSYLNGKSVAGTLITCQGATCSLTQGSRRSQSQ